MRGKKAKALRRAVYADLSHRGTIRKETLVKTLRMVDGNGKPVMEDAKKGEAPRQQTVPRIRIDALGARKQYRTLKDLTKQGLIKSKKAKKTAQWKKDFNTSPSS